MLVVNASEEHVSESFVLVSRANCERKPHEVMDSRLFLIINMETVVHYVTLLVAVESNQYVFYRNEEGNLITKYHCIIFFI